MTKEKVFRDAARNGQFELKMNLSLFANEEKTEKPTHHKRQKSREEGKVAQSNEIGTAFLFLFMFVALRMFAGGIYSSLVGFFDFHIRMIPYYNEYFNVKTFNGVVVEALLRILLACLPIFAVALVVGLAVNFVQVGWHPTTKPLQPKLNKLNPIQGFKKLFSMRSLVELLKSFLKMGLVLIVIYNALKNETNNILKYMYTDLGQGVAYLCDLIARIGVNVGAAYIVIAAIDYIYVRFTHLKELKMTKQEVKDEYKQMEGDQQVKAKIKRRMMEASMRRMMQSVPNADVVVTNPTHYAVCLRYDAEAENPVPVVSAKGVDFLAKRIKDKAREHKIPIVENKPLARTLYANVDVGREIPPELYAACAEILAYVYKLKRTA